MLRIYWHCFAVQKGTVQKGTGRARMWVANAFGSMQTDAFSSQQRASTISMFSRHHLRLNLNHLGLHHRWSRLKDEVLPWPHSRRNGGRLNALRRLHLQLLSGTCSGRHRHHDVLNRDAALSRDASLTRDAHGTGGHEGHEADRARAFGLAEARPGRAVLHPHGAGGGGELGTSCRSGGASAGGFSGILNLKPGFVSNKESPNIVSWHILATSSTAQGGGGSFKNRKPIGEVGCCESRMAERSH